MQADNLTRFAWLSIATAVLTISLKALAYFLTGSVGLLSDALESIVNLVAAFMALAMLTIAARPPDELHAFGHTKAEYFSSGVEGALILLAAAMIMWSAVPRLLAPRALEKVSIGLLVSTMASVANFVVARILLTASRKYRSITLEADAHHLLTDVWTSVGVLAGIALVTITGWTRLDAIVAILVALNIVWTGIQLLRRSALGLMDTSLADDELGAVRKILDHYGEHGIQFHALWTRQAGARKFISVHVLVPGAWTVLQGHQLLEEVEADIHKVVPGVHVFTHLEPSDDPTAWHDVSLDRNIVAQATEV
jgi:cation diffusion facilitator family transporter